MNKRTLLTPFELRLKNAVDVPEPDPDFVDSLRRQILAGPSQKTAPRVWKPSWRLAFSLVIVLTLVVAGLLVGPDRVIAGVRDWLGGFIPGIGFVEDENQVLVLEQPVRLDLDGAAFKVEKGYANADETAVQIAYIHDNRTCAGTGVTHEEYRARLPEQVYLLLPDGTRLYAITPRFANWGKFPALPAGIHEATLVVPPDVLYECTSEEQSTFCQCLDDDLLWRAPLNFVPPAEGSVLPVYDGSTPVPTAEPTQTVPTDQPTPTVTALTEPQPALIGKIVALPDGYLFLVGLNRDPSADVSYTFGMNEHPARLVDASGVEIPIEEVDRLEYPEDLFQDFQWPDVVLYKATTSPLNGPVTLSFPSLVRSQRLNGSDPHFELNLGGELQVGQQIPVNVPVDLFPGHPFSLKYVGIDRIDAAVLGLTLNFEGAGFETIQVNQVPAPALPPQGGSSGSCEFEFTGCFYVTTALQPAPDHRYSLSVSWVDYRVDGPWLITFDLPGG